MVRCSRFIIKISFLAITTYRILSVGFTEQNAETSYFGKNVVCDGTKIPKFATPNFPSKFQRLAFETIAFSFETSIMLLCGGNYVRKSQ